MHRSLLSPLGTALFAKLIFVSLIERLLLPSSNQPHALTNSIVLFAFQQISKQEFRRSVSRDTIEHTLSDYYSQANARRSQQFKQLTTAEQNTYMISRSFNLGRQSHFRLHDADETTLEEEEDQDEDLFFDPEEPADNSVLSPPEEGPDGIDEYNQNYDEDAY